MAGIKEKLNKRTQHLIDTLVECTADLTIAVEMEGGPTNANMQRHLQEQAYSRLEAHLIRLQIKANNSQKGQ